MKRQVADNRIPRKVLVRERAVGVVVFRTLGVLAVEPAKERVVLARQHGGGGRQLVAKLHRVRLVRPPVVGECQRVFDCEVGVGPCPDSAV